MAAARRKTDKTRDDNARASRSYRKRKPATMRRAALKVHGLTLEDYDRMFDRQRGLCLICHQPSPKNLHVDHDHDSGKVRGLLCMRCNVGMGSFDDDPERLFAAALYLEGS